VDRLRALAALAWYGQGARATAARVALAPAAALYAAGTAARNALYDRGVLAQVEPALPAISVGNLSVGGTGKTPVAAWIAGELQRRGGRPAIVMRGYGDDEPEVHRRLNPGVLVVVDPDRVSGVHRAALKGADVAVLDDAFQHRRAARLGDVVLISADRWPGAARTLPAGPFREGLAALRRATHVVITRKAASAAAAGALARHVTEAFPTLPVSRIHLAAAGLVDVASGASRPLAAVAGRPVLAICGVGDPAAFASQLREAGAEVVLRSFQDHHAFTASDVAELAADAAEVAGRGGEAVCTLKDAVKLSPRWPSGEPGLSFLSQQVIVEAGRTTLEDLLDTVIHARKPSADAAG
jgi:tetraacyldisaccharide 4'-kinase